MAVAIFLQSSTAVAMLISQFVSKHGGLTAAVGFAMLLGADVGSAVVTQLLVSRQPWLIPLFLLVGVTLFLRAKNGGFRQTGRIVIGLALIFASLDMLRAATGPMIENPATSTVMGYLGQDLLAAFIIGAGFAWLVHSSVAAVLLFVTLVGQGVIGVPTAAAMVLGANLGGAMIAHLLTLSAPDTARRMVVANLLLRGGGAAVAALLVARSPGSLAMLGSSPEQQAINLHLSFNVVLAVVALPFVRPVTSLLGRIMIDQSGIGAGLEPASALDTAALSKPQRALDCATRELLTAGQKIERMLVEIGPLYDSWNNITAKAVVAEDKAVKKSLLDTKLYIARLGEQELDEQLSRRSMEVALISSNLDAASDAISRVLLQLAKRLDAQGLQFSTQGRTEVQDFADRVLGNVQLALNVLMNQNPGEARELVEAKEKVSRVEQKLQRQHLGRLQEGLKESIETSNIHQETLRTLKHVNTCFSTIGYPILDKSGILLKSRLTSY